VPRILVDARDRGALVLEDVGSISLLDVVRNPDSFESISDLTTGQGDLLYELFSRALSLQTALQRIVRDDQLVVFQRQLSQEQRAVQIREFLEHYANPRGLSPHAARVTQRCMDTVCAHVAAHPLQVSHFDFMAANIHVLPDGELCLIDFQDMCLDSPARDIVSLLNDRGLDEGLGRERQQRLLSFFMSRINQHQEFARLYDEYLLLWDFRVAGRFALLADSRGVERYRAWIPSTLRRLGRTLARTQHRIDGAAETLQALSSFSPEVAQGGSDPWGGIAA
jgi:aminoglycoside/choline kinase family phosphotransferase